MIGRSREVADLLFQHDHILSAMFQPAAYAGNAARLGRPGAGGHDPRRDFSA